MVGLKYAALEGEVFPPGPPWRNITSRQLVCSFSLRERERDKIEGGGGWTWFPIGVAVLFIV